MQGKKEEAFALAGRLIESKTAGYEFWLKKVKALSFIGDDDNVIALFKRAEEEDSSELMDGTFWHWCAVAEYRRGNLPLARAYWKKCLELAPYFSIASENIQELKKPGWDRVCPQAYGFDTWLPNKVIEELVTISKETPAQKEKKEHQNKFKAFYSKHLEIFPFIQEGLANGDSVTREFALKLVDLIASPEILNWVESFALGKDGPDAFRLEAAQILVRHGILKNGQKINMWLKGEIKPTLLFGFNVFSTLPEEARLKPVVGNLMEEAIKAIRNGNGKKAVVLLRKALAIQPNEPSLLNNLAVSLQMQGQYEEVKKITARIENDFPNYFFGQLTSARKEIWAGHFKKAQTILDKIMKRDTLHITEFSALCSCQVDLERMNQNPEGAEYWLEIWEEVYPQDPLLKKYKNPAKTA